MLHGETGRGEVQGCRFDVTPQELSAQLFLPAKGLNLIGPAIRRIRRSRRPVVTLDDLSARLEISGVMLSKSILARVENRQRSVSDYEVIAIAHALGVPMELLYS